MSTAIPTEDLIGYLSKIPLFSRADKSVLKHLAGITAVTSYGNDEAVISKGDDELLNLGGRQAWHFPQHEDGTYAGHHLADSAECIAELARLRAKGADFLVIPSTATWWLDHYEAFARYLTDHCRVVLRNADCAVVTTSRHL